MKKIFNWLIALPALFLLGACAPEDIVFDHEKPAFDTKDGQILLEVIVPSSTKADDVIYIAGAFNGGDEVAAENTMWHLEKSTTIDKKWGIYLDPTTFVEGKTLADGYHFVSVREGEERTALNEAVNRTESPAVGSRTNIYLSYWDMYFFVAPDDNFIPEHEGTIRVYVDNQAGWDAVALYQWGDQNDLGGAWPGMQPTGTLTIAGVRYTYFDYAIADVEGLAQNLIFNNNGDGVQTADQPVTFSADVVDLFYKIYGEKDCEAIANPLEPDTPGDDEEEEGSCNCDCEGCKDCEGKDNGEGEGGEGTEPSDPEPADPVYVYVDDQTGWKTGAHYWNASGFTTQWPGLWLSEQTSKSLSGVEYKVFQVDPEAGAAISIIFHNDQSDAVRLQKDITTDQTRYYTLTATELTETQPKARIYVDDQTGWEAITVYCWGDAEVFGKWPGAQVAGTETIEGKSYKYFEVPYENLGQKVNLIFNNNNGGTQIENKPAQVDLVLDQDYFYTVTADNAVFVE